MKTFLKKITLVVVVVVLIIGLDSCSATQNANNKQKGAVIGAAGGALLGAIIGNNTGKKGSGGELGAVIGGVVGGAAGVLIGSKMDKQAQKIEEEIPGAIVERIDDGIVVTFDENSGVHFNTNKFNINADSQTMLNKLANILQEYPDTPVFSGGFDSAAFDVATHLLVSPGVSLREQSIQKAIVDGAKLISDIDLFSCATDKPVIAITGSNGNCGTSSKQRSA